MRFFLFFLIFSELNNNINRKLRGIKRPIILDEVEKAQNIEKIIRSTYLLVLLNLK